MKYKSVTVIGLGLIGGSVCRAIKKFEASEVVTGIDKSSEVIEFALKNGIVDKAGTELDKAIDSEVVVIATYVDRISDTVEKIIPNLKKGCLITDVGSVKSSIVNRVESIIPDDIYFIGSHPIAGNESSGIENSDPDLFKDKIVVVTPTGNSNDELLSKTKSFWESIGGRVLSLDPGTHDRVFAYVSHLPHAVAYSLVNAVGSTDFVDNILSYSGGGLKDYTRIAASSPEMWKTIFIENKEPVLESIKTFKENLEKTESAIKNDDLNELMNILKQAQKLKFTE